VGRDTPSTHTYPLAAFGASILARTALDSTSTPPFAPSHTFWIRPWWNVNVVYMKPSELISYVHVNAGGSFHHR